MTSENEPSAHVDLDRTDRLPILEGVTIEEDVADDSEPLDHAATVVAMPSSAPPAPAARGAMDLPTLAQSVRSVEERIARHAADYEALNRLYEKARDAQLAAGTRADTLAGELSTAHASLAVEQHRVKELERALSAAAAATDAARSRGEESLREAERAQSEARTLRDELAARDSTIAQALHSLGERDAQLFALQREHAQTVPVLEARSRAREQLETELHAVRGSAEALTAELDQARHSLSALEGKLAKTQSELGQERADLQAARAEGTAYLELLRSRDWRLGFEQNSKREAIDAREAQKSGESALRTECEQLREALSAASGKAAAYEAAIAKLQAAGAAQAEELSRRSQELEQSERARADLQARLAQLADESQHASETHAASEARLAAMSDETERMHAGAEQLRAEAEQLRAEAEQLRAEAGTHEEELTVLMAHLNEARRPMQDVQEDIKRLNAELAEKSLAIEHLTEQNRAVRTTLERTRGALEERELLIRRLERSASNNANVLGRLQTSIERLGSTPAPPVAGEFFAELIKLEGDTRTAYPLGRRTRIGRAPGCELQVDSQSVSRHHALLLKGLREIIIEDLNSTNGVHVNGRKVTRQVLSDGDLLTIGETQFQCRLKPNQRGPEVPPPGTEPAAGTAGALAEEAARQGPAAGEDPVETGYSPQGAPGEALAASEPRTNQ